MKDEQRQRKATERESLQSAIERVDGDGGLERLCRAIEQATVGGNAALLRQAPAVVPIVHDKVAVAIAAGRQSVAGGLRSGLVPVHHHEVRELATTPR